MDQARARFVESGAVGEFDLDGARCEAADGVVVRKVLDTLDYVRQHPRGSTDGERPLVVPPVVPNKVRAGQRPSARQ